MFQTELQNHTSKDEMQTTQTLKQMIGGAWITQGIYVVAQLGIADLLKDGSKSVEVAGGSGTLNFETVKLREKRLAVIFSNGSPY
ncbi:MAG: hypothetical protein RMY36_026345 [Nostoc sp. SerVER01]|nr:hypothetical protein [Nostoc sp. SerVER01]